VQKLNLTLSQFTGGNLFYEFDIDDVPLSNLLQVDLKELTGMFTPEAADSGYFVSQIAKYIGRMPTDRILLYVCSDCGDISCGALSAKLDFTENKIIWSDFAYENSIEIVERYPEVGPFEFSKEEYSATFLSIATDQAKQIAE
jgi:hypothetical protein